MHRRLDHVKNDCDRTIFSDMIFFFMKKRLGDPEYIYQEPSQQNILFTIKSISDSDPEIQSNFIKKLSIK